MDEMKGLLFIGVMLGGGWLYAEHVKRKNPAPLHPRIAARLAALKDFPNWPIAGLVPN